MDRRHFLYRHGGKTADLASYRVNGESIADRVNLRPTACLLHSSHNNGRISRVHVLIQGRLAIRGTAVRLRECLAMVVRSYRDKPQNYSSAR